MTDIQAKYQKLATEFAKVRSQVPVLKKAVLDEQANGEVFKEEIKARDQVIRKYEQEIDSLKFRNQQLSSRVEVLQRELEEFPLKTKKNKKHVMSPVENSELTNSVIGEELQSKIKENAALHSRLFEIENHHQDEVSTLQSNLKKLERDAGHHQNVIDDSINMYTQQIDKLKETQVMLEVKLQKREGQKEEAEKKVNMLTQKLQNIETELSSKLEKANRTIKQQLPFNDSCNDDLNSLNVPSYDRHRQLLCIELLNQLSVLVCDFVQGLSNWYTYTEQRINIYPADSSNEPTSEVTKKLGEYLHQNATYVRPVDQAFKQFVAGLHEDSVISLETTTGLQEFSTCFTKLTAYVSKILPYQLLNLDEESQMSVCTSSLVSRNKELKNSYKCFEAAFTKLETCVSALALPSKSSSKASVPCSSHPKLLSLLSKSVTDITTCFQDLTKHYRAKVILEHELPTITEKLKVTNDCIMPVLLSLVNTTNKMKQFFFTNNEFICRDSNHTQNSALTKVHPNTTLFRQKACNYLSSLTRTCPDSVPYTTSLHNRRTLYSSTESRDSLAQQVVSLQEKFTKSEQSKEHWMLESKLLQMKYEKECQRIQQQQKIETPDRTKSVPDNTPPSVSNGSVLPTTPIVAPGGPPLTASATKMDKGSFHDKDIEARETFIKQYYTEKIAHITEQLQVGDSKALHFHAECRALHKRLYLVQCDKDKLQTDVETSNQSVSQLKDELQTTTNSYEGQLSMLSEHLAAMNEKITTQQDEIVALKYQIQNNTKPSKRGFLGKH